MKIIPTIFNRKVHNIELNQIKVSKIIRSMEFGNNIENFEDLSLGVLLEQDIQECIKKQDLECFLKNFNITSKEYKANKFLIFDTETTDLKGYVVSIAAILYDLESDTILKEKYLLINPQEEISEDAQAVHKISKQEIEEKPIFSEIWKNELQDMFLEADNYVGHNLLFDMQVLEREFERMNIENPLHQFIFDTMLLSKDIAKIKDKNGKKIKNPKLEEMIEYFGISLSDTTYHNALVDTKATLELFKKLINYQFN